MSKKKQPKQTSFMSSVSSAFVKYLGDGWEIKAINNNGRVNAIQNWWGTEDPIKNEGASETSTLNFSFPTLKGS